MSDTGDHVLDHLPVFSDVTSESQWERLRVQGLVEQPLELDQESLLALAQQGIAEDFHCVEGWVVPDQKWEGVPVSTLLGLARPLPEAEYLRFSSGGPCRLIAGAKECNFGVKWVDLIELTATPVDDTGRLIDVSSSHP